MVEMSITTLESRADGVWECTNCKKVFTTRNGYKKHLNQKKDPDCYEKVYNLPRIWQIGYRVFLKANLPVLRAEFEVRDNQIDREIYHRMLMMWDSLSCTEKEEWINKEDRTVADYNWKIETGADCLTKVKKPT
jgi:hypothetical protein